MQRLQLQHSLSIFCLALTCAVTEGADLSSNIENMTSGIELCTIAEPVAMSFTTQDVSHSLDQVHLMLAGSGGAQIMLTLHEDGGMEPGEQVSLLVPASGPTDDLLPVSFTPVSTIELAPQSVYWLVLSVNAGTVLWGWSEDDTGSGPGFDPTWARIGHESGLWWCSDRYALQHRVVVDHDQAPCLGDTDDNGLVDTDDLLTVLAQWGTAGSSGDVDGSGLVDVGDLLIIIANWGACG